MPEEPSFDSTVLDLVLEPYPKRASNQGNYMVRLLSFFSTEQKQLDQAVNLVAEVYEKRWIADFNHRRYFNTLRNAGILAGTSEQPALTALSDVFYAEYKATQGNPSQKLTVEQKNKLDRAILENAMQALMDGKVESVSNIVRQVILNVQEVFDTVDPENIDKIIADESLARRIQSINIEATEPARYFRLPEEKQQEFQTNLDRLLALADLPEGTPENIKAYHEAARRVQADARFRVQMLLRAYRDLRQELGERLPYLRADKTVANIAPPAMRRALPKADGAKLDAPQLIVSGCPGSGKSHWIDERLEESGAVPFRVQFHAELGFSEFVGSFKPQTLYEDSQTKVYGPDGAPAKQRRPLIDYTFVPGPFTNALVHAYSHPEDQVVIVIEEINRGNAAAAFGELFQTLDRDDGGYSRYPVTPQADYAAYLASVNALKDDKIVLPPNLFIWASMNGADQNVHPLDTAFRRRWTYKYMGYSEPNRYPDDDRVIRYGGQNYDWEKFRSILNAALIDLNIDEDKLIGAYFLTPAQLKSPAEILSKLLLYLWDDVLRFNRPEMFKDKSFADVEIRWRNGDGEPLVVDFGKALLAASVAEEVGEPDTVEEVVVVPTGAGEAV